MDPVTAQAIGLFLAAFPGTRILPVLITNPDGLRDCSLGCGHITALIDTTGAPVHKACLYAQLNLALD